MGEARTANQIAALALFDDVDRAGDVYGRLGQFGPRAVDTFKACAKGTHEAIDGDLHGLIDEASTLVRELRRQ